MSINPEELAQVDPGVRELVRLLNELGWETTDSGDGVSKPADECAMDIPHVFIMIEPELLVSGARVLKYQLAQRNIVIGECGDGGGWIEATYDPGNNIAIIGVLGLTL